MLHTLIFDWDGTLHNTKGLYGRAFRAAYGWLVQQGHAPDRIYTDDEICCYLGMNAPDMWQSFMPQLPEPVWQEASRRIGAGMIAQVEAGQAILYDGAPDVLAGLKGQGYQLVFLSNCKRPYMQAHMRAFGLERYFDGFYCCQDFDYAPKTRIFSHIAQRFPGGYCVIGDRSSDLEVGMVHGFPSIACAYGFGTPEEWRTAAAVATDVTQLPRLVAEISQIGD